jgi:uncharacterized protein (TIGR03437 family)
MMKRRTLLSALAAAALLPGVVCAQTSFDNSGNSLLQGTYFIRQVWYGSVSTSGIIGEAASLTGTITFNGSGNYTLTAQVSDNTISSGAPQPLSISAGNYSVNASGMILMDDPLSAGDFIYGGVGPSAITGSATESLFFDFMVAVPMATSVTNASLNGSYQMVGMEYPNGDVTQVSNYAFTINPDGAGNLGALSLSGHAVNVSDNLYTQSISGATYSLSGATGTMTFPAQSSGTSLISGTKQFFVSADGNILVGGSLDGYDIQIGINVTGSAASANFNGTYFSGGEDYDSSSFAANGYYYLDAFFGSTHATTTGGNTTAVADQRIDPDDANSYDFTFFDQFSLGSNGTATEPSYLYFVGASGAARVLIGQSTTYSIELDVQAQTPPVSGSVILNPLGVVNGANYLPITNPVAPGEFVTLFGTGLGPASVAQAALPYPTTLGGVSVSVDGTPAPVQLASSGQINFIVPYEITDPFAVVTVSYNGATSNAVTLYTDSSAPGVFSLDESGTGDAAALHPDGLIVNAGNPSQVGETIAVYVTGLGTVSPASADGVAASSTTLSNTDDTIDVYIDNVQATVSFEGLAPGFAGLYQVNFVVPSIPDSGPVNLDIFDENNGAYNSIASLEVAATGASARPKAIHSAHGKRTRARGKIRSKADVAPNRRQPGLKPAPLQP